MSHSKRHEQAESLAARRQFLIVRAGAQREHLAATLAPLFNAAATIDSRVHSIRNIAANPVVLGAAAGLLLMIGPRRAFGWIKKGVEIWLFAKGAKGLGNLGALSNVAHIVSLFTKRAG